jgi:methionyl-tRNA formyltransferase
VRLVFLGTPAMALPTLAAVAAQHEVAAVVCQPDRPQGRSSRLVAPPVKEWALAHGIAVQQPERLNDGQFAAWLRSLAPEAGVVVAYGRLLKQAILDVPVHGFLNVHPSLLPRWRGPSPVNAALLAGDAETGVSIMRLNAAMDAGDIVLQERVRILPEETAGELTERLAALGARMMCTALEQIAAGKAQFHAQGETGVCYCRLMQKEDGRLDWRRPARDLHNQVRGCNPWPVAHTVLRGASLRVYRSRVSGFESCGPPGTIAQVETNLLRVNTGAGTLDLLELQLPGKKALPVDAFLRGIRLECGEPLGEVS